MAAARCVGMNSRCLRWAAAPKQALRAQTPHGSQWPKGLGGTEIQGGRRTFGDQQQGQSLPALSPGEQEQNIRKGCQAQHIILAKIIALTVHGVCHCRASSLHLLAPASQTQTPNARMELLVPVFPPRMLTTKKKPISTLSTGGKSNSLLAGSPPRAASPPAG